MMVAIVVRGMMRRGRGGIGMSIIGLDIVRIVMMTLGRGLGAGGRGKVRRG